MFYPIQEELVKIQPKGLLTIPKKLREEVGFTEGAFARVKGEKGRLIIEPVRTLPYQVRSYSDSDLKEFFAEDERETKLLKKKGLLK